MVSPEALNFAGVLAPLGHEVRLEVLRLLLAAHPEGMVVGELQRELEIPPSTLSHHLETLRQVELVEQRREGRFLRYRAGTRTLQRLLDFLYAECCTRHPVVELSAPRAAHRKG